VPIGDKKIALVALLKSKPIRQRAMIVPQMKLARRPHAANDDFHSFPVQMIAK
jgi:hypothetical protein